MSARYTSPDLSRRLRDAGLEQAVAGSDYWLLGVPDRRTFTPEIRNGGLRKLDTSVCGEANLARALRLDEVLEELRRERTGGPLALDVSLNVHPMITTIEIEAVGVHPTYARHAVPVEAAGLVLAQLLEARRG